MSDEGPRQPPPPSRAAAAEDPAPPKGGEEDPNKSAAVQQQQQPETAGGQAPQKERSKSDPSAGATVMNRVRGGVRMFIGKVSGNREKVEEGERLKRGAQ